MKIRISPMADKSNKVEIKPNNINLEKSFQKKIRDFGISINIISESSSYLELGIRGITSPSSITLIEETINKIIENNIGAYQELNIILFYPYSKDHFEVLLNDIVLRCMDRFLFRKMPSRSLYKIYFEFILSGSQTVRRVLKVLHFLKKKIKY